MEVTPRVALIPPSGQTQFQAAPCVSVGTVRGRWRCRAMGDANVSAFGPSPVPALVNVHVFSPLARRSSDMLFLRRRGFLTLFGSTQHIFLKGNAAAKLFMFFFFFHHRLSTAN